MEKGDNEPNENSLEEELENNDYDEYDFPVTNIKGSSFYGITMHKLKYDYDYWCKIDEEKPSESNFRKNLQTNISKNQV